MPLPAFSSAEWRGYAQDKSSAAEFSVGEDGALLGDHFSGCRFTDLVPGSQTMAQCFKGGR